jgi:hypothetical protein
MPSTLAKITSRIAALQEELSELRIAERVTRRLENGQAESDSSADDIGEQVVAHDLRGKTVVEVAKQILSESSGPLHFKAVHDRAKMRGYKSRGKGDNYPTFWATLTRNKDVFQSMGGGKYALKKIGGDEAG